MIRWAVVFFIAALVAAYFGYGGVISGDVLLARILFVVFLILFAASVASLITRGRGRN